jgi:glycosyltransferase involved in cell wall biosynthesis
MRIVHIIPGTGGTFYCQNCVRDAALVQELRARGHDVVMIPLYLTLFAGASHFTADAPVFFGGVNVYLQQRFSIFRKTPRWVDRLFDATWMLSRAARREGSVSAAELGPMTLSMLKGPQGNQRKELDRLVAWIRERERPDVIHISNALLLGLVGELRRTLEVPIVCSLQDEDAWIDAMGAPYDRLCWDAMAERAADVDVFVAVSEWYAEQMAVRLGMPRDRISVVPLGIDLDDVEPAQLPLAPPVIGYLSRMSESQGLGLLVDAFIKLKQDPRLRDLRLKATGGITAADTAFVSGLQRKLKRHGVQNDAEFLSDFEKPKRREFLRSITVLSVPVVRGAASGEFMLEALAFGVPVVQPSAGSFPELVNDTGGGLVYALEEEDGLVKALMKLLLDPGYSNELGQRGRAAVFDRYGIDRMAGDVLAVYQSLEAK